MPDPNSPTPDDLTTRQEQLGRAFMAIYGNPLLGSDPHRLYSGYRQEPGRWMGPLLLVSSRELVDDALRQPGALSSGMASAQLGNTRPLIPMQVDPPDHAGYRRVLDPLFSRKALAPHEEFMVALADRLIDRVEPAGRCDFTEAIATPFPALVLLHLLGLPESDLEALQEAKNAIVHPPRRDMAETARMQQAAGQELYEYFGRVVSARRAAPGDDLISRLTLSRVANRELTLDEIVDICYLLVLAGLDTVTDSLTLSWAYLARHNEHRKALVADVGLIPTAIDELLRWESPIPGVPRIATTDTRVGGCPVTAGDVVYITLGSANTDEMYLPDADQVRLDRAPNRHLAFGGGIHRCLGSHLAKIQISTMMRRWHVRIPEYHIPPDVVLTFTPGLRSVVSLPLMFRAGTNQNAR